MLRCLAICPTCELGNELAATLRRVPNLEIARTLSAYPTPDELLRIIRVRKIELLLLCATDFEKFSALATHVDNFMPGLPIVAFGGGKDVDLLVKLMHMGIREHLPSPLESDALSQSVKFVEKRLEKHPLPSFRLSDIYTFLPAKPGVGTSTIAVSTSCALSEDYGARTLLMDCDLSAGAIQFLLKLSHSASVVDALTHAEDLDEDLWFQMVGKWGKLEVLHAGELDPPPSIEITGVERVLNMARAQYEVICADLASSLDSFSIAFMRESRKIFLVTTPEVIALHMAAARMRRLNDIGLGDRVSLLVNRKVKSELTDAEVSKAVGLPVSYSFSNDYAVVRSSILEGSPVAHNSDLGQCVLNLAHSLAPHLSPERVKHHRKFLEFFHIPHGEPGDVVWKD